MQPSPLSPRPKSATLRPLAHLDDADIRAEIDVAIKTTLTQGFGMNHSLCHGDLGNIELLLQASQVFNDAELHAQTYRIAACAQEIVTELSDASWQISDMTAKQKERRPSAPFITSTLQQKASSQLKMKPKKTMEIAQKLYEGGHITYMRTDSPHTALEAVQAARSVIKEHFPQALPDSPPTYSAKTDAQEAHECIRPTDPALLPDNAPISGAALAHLSDVPVIRSVNTSSRLIMKTNPNRWNSLPGSFDALNARQILYSSPRKRGA